MKNIKEVNPWLELWAKHIANDTYCNDPAYWSNTARDYNRKILPNDRLLRTLNKYVDSGSTVLDIGAGTGYVALALAPFVKKVTAVEPAEGMLNVLREKAESSGIINIDYINGKWESAKTCEHDTVLASHCIYCIKNPFKFLLKMHKSARRFVIFILFTNFDLISMSGKKPSKPSYLLFYNMLCSLGIYANIEIFKSYRRFFYKSKEDALRDMKERMSAEYILRNIKENGGEVFLDVEADEVLIWYRKDDSSFEQ